MGKKIITIGRQTGSGGHEIAERLAERLNIPLHDRNVVVEAVKELKLDHIEDISTLDEKVVIDHLDRFSKGYHAIFGKGKLYHMMDISDEVEPSISEKMFETESKIIKSLADMGPCIIIGRCADSILRGRDDVLSVFICADDEHRIKRMMLRRDLTYERAENVINLTDRERSRYYKACTDRKWGVPENYDITLSSSNLGIDGVIEILAELYEG